MTKKSILRNNEWILYHIQDGLGIYNSCIVSMDVSSSSLDSDASSCYAGRSFSLTSADHQELPSQSEEVQHLWYLMIYCNWLITITLWLWARPTKSCVCMYVYSSLCGKTLHNISHTLSTNHKVWSASVQMHFAPLSFLYWKLYWCLHMSCFFCSLFKLFLSYCCWTSQIF